MEEPAVVRLASTFIDTTPRDRVDNDKYWRQNGACVSADPDLFTGPDEETRHESIAIRQVRLSLAKSICRLCTVQQQCFEHAIAEPDSDSVRAGLLPFQVKEIRRQINLSAEHHDDLLLEFKAKEAIKKAQQIA